MRCVRVGTRCLYLMPSKWCVRVKLCFYSQSTCGVCELSCVFIKSTSGVCGLSCVFLQSTSGVCGLCCVFIHRAQVVCASLAVFVFTEYKGFVLAGWTVFVWLYSHSTYWVVLDEVQLFVWADLCLYLTNLDVSCAWWDVFVILSVQVMCTGWTVYVLGRELGGVCFLLTEYKSFVRVG